MTWLFVDLTYTSETFYAINSDCYIAEVLAFTLESLEPIKTVDPKEPNFIFGNHYENLYQFIHQIVKATVDDPEQDKSKFLKPQGPWTQKKKFFFLHLNPKPFLNWITYKNWIHNPEYILSPNNVFQTFGYTDTTLDEIKNLFFLEIILVLNDEQLTTMADELWVIQATH